jgi:ABC-2 type transport system ATP-binding protein
VVIDRGRLVGEGTIEELKGRTGGDAVLALNDPTGGAHQLLEQLDGVRAVELAEVNGILRGSLQFADDVEDRELALEKVVAALARADVGVRQATVAKATLEDVFAQLTAPQAANETNATPQVNGGDDAEESS